MTQFFNGRVLIAPQVEVAIDDSAIGPSPVGGSTLAVGILGYSTKGQPAIATLVTSADEATTAFGQGTLVDGILRAMNPAGDGGALAVYGVRVNAGLQSSGSLLDFTPLQAIALTTRDYGMLTRSYYVNVEAATGAGSNNIPASALKVTASDGAQPVSADNVGYNALSVSYQQTGGQVLVQTWSGLIGDGGYTYVATPITTITVVNDGYDVGLLAVGQQIIIADSGGGNPVTTNIVTSDGAGVLTISPGDIFSRDTSATVTATGTSLMLVSTDPTDTAGYPLVNYATLGDLARAAKATGGLGNWDVLVPTRFNSVPGARVTVGATSSPTLLDLGTSTLALTANSDFTDPTLYVTLTGVAQAVTDWLNGKQDPYFTAVRQAVGTIPNVQTVVATGGDDDGNGGSLLANTMTVSNEDWNNGLNALSQVDTPVFTLMIGDASVHALGNIHAHTVSTSGKLERIQLAGGILGESTADAVARASVLDSERSALVYPGIQDFDSNGNLVTLAPYYAAAQTAGLAAGLGYGGSITNKILRIQGLEVRSSGNGGAYTQADYDTLLLAGVIGLQRRPTGGFKVVQGVTTWQEDDKFTHRELTVRMSVDNITKTMRQRLETIIGSLIGPALLSAARSIVQSVLDTFAQEGVIVGDSVNPPYQGISISVPRGHADTLLVSAECSPGIPANYILFTLHVTPFNGVGQ